jgi:hypothetical protein
MKMKKQKGEQQGDVLIKVIDRIPNDAIKLNHGCLAEGEATGHHHSLTNLGLAILLQKNNDLYLKVIGKEVQVTHQEHDPVTIRKGNYKIEIVREYDPFANEARNVID